MKRLAEFADKHDLVECWLTIRRITANTPLSAVGGILKIIGTERVYSVDHLGMDEIHKFVASYQSVNLFPPINLLCF